MKGGGKEAKEGHGNNREREKDYEHSRSQVVSGLGSKRAFPGGDPTVFLPGRKRALVCEPSTSRKGPSMGDKTRP